MNNEYIILNSIFHFSFFFLKYRITNKQTKALPFNMIKQTSRNSCSYQNNTYVENVVIQHHDD